MYKVNWNRLLYQRLNVLFNNNVFISTFESYIRQEIFYTISIKDGKVKNEKSTNGIVIPPQEIHLNWCSTIYRMVLENETVFLDVKLYLKKDSSIGYIQ